MFLGSPNGATNGRTTGRTTGRAWASLQRERISSRRTARSRYHRAQRCQRRHCRTRTPGSLRRPGSRTRIPANLPPTLPARARTARGRSTWPRGGFGSVVAWGYCSTPKWFHTVRPVRGQRGQHSFAGTNGKAAQSLGRHSDPMLTLNTCTKLGIRDVGEALDGLPGIDRPDDANERAAQRAVGTYDHRPTPLAGGRATNDTRTAKPCDPVRNGQTANPSRRSAQLFGSCKPRRRGARQRGRVRNSRCSGSNRGPVLYESTALPLSYTGSGLTAAKSYSRNTLHRQQGPPAFTTPPQFRLPSTGEPPGWSTPAGPGRRLQTGLSREGVSPPDGR